jgi:uncharacterized protein YbcI
MFVPSHLKNLISKIEHKFINRKNRFVRKSYIATMDLSFSPSELVKTSSHRGEKFVEYSNRDTIEDFSIPVFKPHLKNLISKNVQNFKN